MADKDTPMLRELVIRADLTAAREAANALIRDAEAAANDKHDWPTTTTTRPCACGAMMLDSDELANGPHVQPVDGSWMCVPDEPATLKETPRG